VRIDATLSRALTRDGEMLGSADFIAPEQVENPHSVNFAADLYSLGCTFYSLLVGAPPFGSLKQASFFQKAMAHVERPVTPISQHRTDVPEAVEQLVIKLLAKKPQERPASAGDLAEALRSFTSRVDLRPLAT
jgi:serine/threonine protein kinase